MHIEERGVSASSLGNDAGADVLQGSNLFGIVLTEGGSRDDITNAFMY